MSYGKAYFVVSADQDKCNKLYLVVQELGDSCNSEERTGLHPIDMDSYSIVLIEQKQESQSTQKRKDQRSSPASELLIVIRKRIPQAAIRLLSMSSLIFVMFVKRIDFVLLQFLFRKFIDKYYSPIKFHSHIFFLLLDINR